MPRSRKRKKIRYAVVGIGYISQAAVLPAFEGARKNSELTALVSDDPLKLRELGEKYNVELLYSYEEYEDCLRSEGVDAVYIALPNHLHHQYTLRAANAGIHVLCEKPMAVTPQQCGEMIESARENHVKLMLSYRLHFERGNLKAIETVRSGEIGEPRIFQSAFSMQVKEENIRLNDVSLGGGPLYDLGIYCINAARYLFQAEPIEVMGSTARSGDPRFANCEEMMSAILRFPDERVAQFVCSFGAADVSSYTVIGTKGRLNMDPAYEHSGELVMQVTVEEKPRKEKFKKRDQFAAVLSYFSDCILRDSEPEPNGLEGLADVRVIEALHRSAAEGRAIRLEPFDRERRPSMEQEIEKPPHDMPELVHAEAPSEE